ncbi:MAG: preprotein translocase subunit SecA [Deltaproteobacteria bacterium]|nr:preprotein translocase subunit SecA [Deltaproteobacteria bacterium]
MLAGLGKKIFGSANEREIKRLGPFVEKINSLELQFEKFSENELCAKTDEFKKRLSEGYTLDDLLPEAFAIVREASKRTLKMRHYDVQLIGGIILHQGKIAEMKTGEGKTLVATLPLYLNALKGKGCHLVTVNDYLAQRDSEWMKPIYNLLGLSVGVIVHGLDDRERQAAYGCDITYGTNNEFGFDYLRDNMKYSLKDFAQRDFHYCIVDEVDSILIDEARTPLIISGSSEESTDKYYKVNSIIPYLSKEKNYTIDEKAKTAVLTEDGIMKVEQLLKVDNLYDPRNIELVHHVNQALKAHALFKRDVDYVVKDGEVLIVDEFTGRLMPGRRYSDGLHQALEAKEGVTIENENQTLASVTFQNFFRMYEKLAGMTGTAETEAAEFKKIYDLDVAVIPTNQPIARTDYSDIIYKNKRGKYKAIIQEIQKLHEEGRPVLVGTIAIETSELLSTLLKREGLSHHVLNAKHHDKEAKIIAEAGQPGAVTIATNMAGRGTDIKLGPGVAEKGGLHILGTERHESRRIDNQLRGRSGRQGDKGSSRFYLSLEDDLLRIFGGERITSMMERFGFDEDEPIEHRMITKGIERAQKKVEAHNFDIRKHLLEYDDVMNTQRDVIYHQRREILKGENVHSLILENIQDIVENYINDFVNPSQNPEDWDFKILSEAFFKIFNIRFENLTISSSKEIEEFKEKVKRHALEFYENKLKQLGETISQDMEKMFYLHTIDIHWKDHLLAMDHLKEGIGLRGYAQKDPLLEYKKEGFQMFQSLDFRIKEDVIERLYKVELAREEDIAVVRRREQEMKLIHQEAQSAMRAAEAAGRDKALPQSQPIKRENPKVGRNDPCPCGSGQKFKKCHGK